MAPVYTCATSNVPVISVLTAPFSLPPNGALLLRIMPLFGERKNGRVKTKMTGAFEVAPVYTGATSNAPVIFVLTAPFSLPPNRALLLRIMSLFGERKNGRVKTKMTGAFEVAPVYIVDGGKLNQIFVLVGRGLVSVSPPRYQSSGY